MTNEEIMAHQAKERAFAATEIGKLFNTFVRALGSAWQLDTQAGWADNVSDKRLKDVWEASNAAQQAFRTALEALMAKDAARLKSTEREEFPGRDRPPYTVGTWCQPGDEPDRAFILRFGDADRREMVFMGPEAADEAWAAWDRWAPAWNVYLFGVMGQADRPGEAEQRCETTLTIRASKALCVGCGTYPDNLGPCRTWLRGPEGRCTYCDHGPECHLAALAASEPPETSGYAQDITEPRPAQATGHWPWDNPSTTEGMTTADLDARELKR